MYGFVTGGCPEGLNDIFVTSGYQDRGLRTLMIVSRLCYISTLKHHLLRARYKYSFINICGIKSVGSWKSWYYEIIFFHRAFSTASGLWVIIFGFARIWYPIMLIIPICYVSMFVCCQCLKPKKYLFACWSDHSAVSAVIAKCKPRCWRTKLLK